MLISRAVLCEKMEYLHGHYLLRPARLGSHLNPRILMGT
jgi:hypothetical protein